MMVVVVGILKEGIESGWCSVTTVFICFVAGIFIIGGILHPMVCELYVIRAVSLIVFSLPFHTFRENGL